MYGSVLGASVTAGSVAVLPNTGSSKVVMVLTLVSLAVGVSITVITLSRVISTKFFAQ